MKFSVIIPVRNRPVEIARCVAAVRAGSWPDRDFISSSPPGSSYEILVVDNGSTDATARAAEAAGARVINEPRPNRCRARNAGAAAARGEWLAFIDSDCIATPTWLAGLTRAVEALQAHEEAPGSPGSDRSHRSHRSYESHSPERVAAIAGAILPATPATTVEAYISRRKWIDQEKFLTPGRRFSPPFAATANLAIRREAFEAIGGFDPDLATAGEDADWCWRAARQGWALRYAPDAAVVHCHRATLGGLWRQAFHYGVGNAELFAKWRGVWGAQNWIAPEHYVWALKGFLKSPLAALTAATPLERREPLYDGLANLAMALGRARGGLRHKVWVI